MKWVNICSRESGLKKPPYPFHHQSFFAENSPEHQMFLVLFAEITYITLIAIFMEKEAFLQKRTPYDFICYKILFQVILFTFLKDEN